MQEEARAYVVARAGDLAPLLVDFARRSTTDVSEDLRRENQRLRARCAEIELETTQRVTRELTAHYEKLVKPQSNDLGAAQEQTLLEVLSARFPFADVEDTSSTPQAMDLRLTLPDDCVIAVESKFYRKNNVPAAEIEKFERDYAALGVAGGILIARKRVDVLNGYSTRVGENLRRAGPNTFYVEHSDYDALTRAVMIIYGGRFHQKETVDMTRFNEVLKQMAIYVQRQNDMVSAVWRALKGSMDAYNVSTAPLVAALHDVRDEMDGACIEQVVRALQLRGSLKRKRR
jgi:hypothetical protein